MKKTVVIDISNPDSWPVRMTMHEVAAVMRYSVRTLYDRIDQGRFPKSDDGRSWEREVVERYVKGGIRTFERDYEKRQRRGTMRVVEPVAAGAQQ